MHKGTKTACLVAFASLTALGTVISAPNARAQQAPVPLFRQNTPSQQDATTTPSGTSGSLGGASGSGLSGNTASGSDTGTQSPSASGAANSPSSSAISKWFDKSSAGKADPDAIQTLELQSVDAESVGTLDRGNGGLGVDMWNGTSRQTAASLIDAMPDAPATHAARNLERRILLSVAATPADHKDISLLMHRVAKLMAIGALDDAVSLIQAMPQKARNTDLAQAEVNALLASGREDEACKAIDQYSSTFDDAFWLKAGVYCQLRAQDKSGAAFTADLVRELEGETDKVFFALNRAIRGTGNVKSDLLKNPRPLDMAMLRLTKQSLPTDDLSTLDAPILIGLIDSPNTDDNIRLEAARLAENKGFITPTQLAVAYKSLKFSDAELDDALNTGNEGSPARQYAKLYQAAAKSDVPAARAEILAHYFEVARNNGDFGQAARLSASLLSAIPVNNDFAWFSVDALRASLSAHNLELAGQWLKQAKASATPTNAIQSRLIVLYPVLALAGLEDTGAPANPAEANATNDMTSQTTPASFGLGGAVSVTPPKKQAAATSDAQARHRARMDEWQEQQQARNDQVAAREDAELVYTLFDAFGIEVPEKLWTALLKPPFLTARATPNAALLHRLNEASAKGQRGTVATLSVIVNSQISDATVLDPASFGATAFAMQKAGLGDDARRMAVETLLANGL